MWNISVVQKPLRHHVRTVLDRAGIAARDLPSQYPTSTNLRLAIPLPPPKENPLSMASFDQGLHEALAFDFAHGLPLTTEHVQTVLDDEVRPALHADGGDIILVDIRDQDIYVKLIGACGTCPSAITTMRLGVERLLQDNFPSMNELINVDDAA